STLSSATTVMGSTALLTSTTRSRTLKSHGHKPSPPPPPPPPPPPTVPTITLTSGELLLGKNITIQGPGAGALKVYGGTSQRAFEISPGVTATLSGMTVNGTTAGFGYGGGIANHGALTVSACNISGTCFVAEGGGIFNDTRRAGGGIFSDGTLILDSTKVIGNTSDYGGGVYNGGTLTLRNSSSITGNGWYNDDVDNIGTLIRDDTSTIGVLYSVDIFT